MRQWRAKAHDLWVLLFLIQIDFVQNHALSKELLDLRVWTSLDPAICQLCRGGLRDRGLTPAIGAYLDYAPGCNTNISYISIWSTKMAGACWQHMTVRVPCSWEKRKSLRNDFSFFVVVCFTSQRSWVTESFENKIYDGFCVLLWPQHFSYQ